MRSVDVDTLLAMPLEHAWGGEDAPPRAANDGAPAGDARLERARALAMRLPPSVEGHGGDAALMVAARELATILGEDADAIATVLADAFNPRCAPPWPRAKLEREARRAAAAQGEPVARAFARERARRERDSRTANADDGAAWAHAPEDPPADAEALLRHGRMVDRSKPPAPLVYVIEGLDLAPGKVSAIQAFANVAKTPFALLMTICVAAGKPFLGFDVSQRNALFLAFEGGILTEEREARLCAGLGLKRMDVPLHFMHVDSAIGDDFLDDLVAYMKAHTIGFVALDTYGSALPGDVEHNSDKFSFWLKQLGKLSDMTGALIVVLLHENKNANANGLRKMSGHNSAPGAIQAAIGLERTTDADRTLIDVYCSREVRKAFPRFRVQFTDAPHADAPTGQSLLATRKPATDEQADLRPQNTRTHEEAQRATATAGRRIWIELGDNQNHSFKDLAAVGGEGHRPAERALARLRDARLVDRAGGTYAITEAGRAATPGEVERAVTGIKAPQSIAAMAAGKRNAGGAH